MKNPSPAHWTSLLPLIELPAVGAAPDRAALRAALPGYIDKFARHAAQAIPQDKPLGLDARYVSPGYAHPLRLLATIAHGIAQIVDRPLVPVLGETTVTRSAVLSLIADFAAYVLRVRTAMTTPTQVGESVGLLQAGGIARTRRHLMIEQYSIVAEEPTARLALVLPYLDAELAAAFAASRRPAARSRST